MIQEKDSLVFCLFCYLLVWFTKRPFSKLEKPEHEGNYFLF